MEHLFEKVLRGDNIGACQGLSQIIPMHPCDEYGSDCGQKDFHPAAMTAGNKNGEHYACQHRNYHTGIQNDHEHHAGNEDY